MSWSTLEPMLIHCKSLTCTVCSQKDILIKTLLRHFVIKLRTFGQTFLSWSHCDNFRACSVILPNFKLAITCSIYSRVSLLLISCHYCRSVENMELKEKIKKNKCDYASISSSLEVRCSENTKVGKIFRPLPPLRKFVAHCLRFTQFL